MTTATATRSRRARTAATEVVQPTPEPELEALDIPQLVSRFLDGGNGKSGDFTSIDGALYESKRVIARRGSDGSVILSNDSIDNVELNDQLMGRLFAGNHAFRRISGFNQLTSATHRSAELKAGTYDDFRAVANLFGFTYSDEDFAAIDRAKEFNGRVSEFFTNLQTEERDRIRTAEEKERAERAAKLKIAWDTGTGAATNYDIRGEGGGQRLRLRARQTGRVQRIETSQSQSLTIVSAKRAFDFASAYWHGGGRVTHRRNPRGYNIAVDHNSLSYGCQSITRAEAERFADSMNWERAKPA